MVKKKDFDKFDDEVAEEVNEKAIDASNEVQERSIAETGKKQKHEFVQLEAENEPKNGI